MSDTPDLEKLEAALRQRFKPPVVILKVDRQNYTGIGDEVPAMLVGTKQPFSAQLDEYLTRGVFPHRMVVAHCNLAPFLDSRDTAVEAFSDHLDAMLALCPVTVDLPTKDVFLAELQAQGPVKLSDLAKAQTCLQAATGQWSSETEYLSLNQIFRNSDLAEAWQEVHPPASTIQFRQWT